MEIVCSIIHFSFLYMYMACLIINYCVSAVPRDSWGQRIFPVGMMGKALAHIRHIE